MIVRDVDLVVHQFPCNGILVLRVMGHAWYFVTPACIIILNGHVSSERFLDCACSEEDSREVFVGILVMEACCDELCDYRIPFFRLH